MASSLLELRKHAGFRSAKDFAAAEGIAEATYARYESNPEKIPLKSAWQLADRFGVSIDAIVGRQPADAAESRNEIQQAYDALSERSKKSFRDYLAFLSQEDKRHKERLTANENLRYDALCYRLEQVFLADLEKNNPDLLFFGENKQVRQAFEKFLNERVNAKQNADARAAVEKTMTAYDRMHGVFECGGVVFNTTTIDFGNPYINAQGRENASNSAR